MAESCVRNIKLEETGFFYTMSLIQGKYKMYILYTLMPILDQLCEWGDKNRR